MPTVAWGLMPVKGILSLADVAGLSMVVGLVTEVHRSAEEER